MAEDMQPKVKLYWLNKSRAQRIVWLLEELNIDYDVEIFHRTKQMTAPKEFEKVHKLGKFPVVTVTPPAAASTSEADAAGAPEPIVLAESGFMSEYLVEHFGQGKELVPEKWKDGMEGKIGGETDAWMRYEYYMHYVEGSFMPVLVMAVIMGVLKSPQVPFFVRPLTSAVANRIFDSFIFPNTVRHLSQIEEHLSKSPAGGPFLCGSKLTAADIMLSYPLMAAKTRLTEFGSWEGGRWDVTHPRIKAYIELLESQEGFKRSVKKIEELDGEKFSASL